MGALDDQIAILLNLPPAKQQELIKVAQEATKHRIWVPNPGPQTAAFFSDADELLFGGEAGLMPVIDVRAVIWSSARLQRSTAEVIAY